jgi:hypothetical protein
MKQPEKMQGSKSGKTGKAANANVFMWEVSPSKLNMEASELHRKMASWHFHRSISKDLNPKRRAFHRAQWRTISAKLKKNNQLHSTGRICVKLTGKKMKHETNNSHCVVCKKPCCAPRGNWNANSVSLCKSKKCRTQRRTELQRKRRKQKLMAFAMKPTKKSKVKLARSSKHNSRAKANKTSRAESQNWKSGATLAPK